MYKCINKVIDPANQLPPATGELLCVPSRVQFAVFGCLDQEVGLRKEPIHDTKALDECRDHLVVL